MNNDELVLIWFNYEGFSFSRVEKILKRIDKIEEILDTQKIKELFFDEEYKKFAEKVLSTNFDEFKQKVEDDLYKYGIEAITFVSEFYPDKLKNIDDPPLVLYVKGDKELLHKKSISIVGTRKPTTYGRIVCEKFTKVLSESNLVTVSGLAYGIDTIVAETTLSSGGKTIAVLAGGLDSIYPSQNNSLANKIVETGGLLVSEYRVGLRPQNYFFVSRNRIVSSLSLGLLIIEAGRSSGTMTTAKYALDQSRELFVVPGNINSAQSEGTNLLIDQMPDIFTISPERILSKLGIEKKEISNNNQQIDILELKILNLLDGEGMSFDNICEKIDISSSELSSKLIKMEMFGLIKKGNGNIYYKNM